MRALGYFTFDPDTGKGPLSYPELFRAFVAYCEEGRHIRVGVYDDPKGQEGGVGWRSMLDFISGSGLGYLVVVPDAGRLGGSLEQQVARLLELDALSCQVVCDDRDFPDPLQNALRGSSSAAGRSARIRQGMMAKAAQGLGLGKPPYGYRIIADGTFRVVAEEADVVALIFKQYLESNDGVRAVASMLNDRGLRTRTGRRWSMVTVRDILRNTAYIGTYRRFGLRIPGSYQPIVTPGDFRQAQERMHERSPARRSPRGSPFLLSGVVFCGYCGQRMMGVTRKQAWRRKDGQRARAEYRYYQCQSRINRNECDYHTTRADDIEEQVARAVREKLLSGERGDGADSGSWMAHERAQSTARLRVLDKRFMEGVQRAASGGLTLGQLRAGVDRLRAAKQALNDRIDQTSEKASAQALLEANAARFIDDWDSLAQDQRRELLRSVVAKVTVKDGRAEVSLA